MENTKNNSFEEQWQRAFDDASLSPSEAVWEKIDLQLDTNIPPKSDNSSYYIGAISAVILGVGLWFFMSKKEEEKALQVVESKVVILENNKEKEFLNPEEKLIIKSKEKAPIRKVSTPIIKEEVIKPMNEPEIITQILENQERIITDSIDFMSPIMATKKMSSELVNPSINIPFEQTPYYEIPKPKSKRKSVWDKVKISGGVGVY